MISVRRTFRQPFRAPQSTKPFLYPRGTLLADIPPYAKGLTPMEYLDHCIAQWKKAEPEPIPVQAATVPQFGTRRRAR